MVTMRPAVCLAVAALSLGCYGYVPVTLDAVPVGARVRALISTEAELRLHDSLGLDLRELDGTLVERAGNRLLLDVRTGVGSSTFGGQPMHQRIAMGTADVLRIDTRRVHRVKTGVLMAALAGVATIVAIKALGEQRPGRPPPGGGPPPE